MTELSGHLFADLCAAFGSEAMAVQRYGYFAQTAQIEGHHDVARLFAELAESASCVAHGHIDFLQYVADPCTDRPIGETSLNVASAVAGELHDGTTRYAQLAGVAHAEGLADVASWLETLCALKRAHVARLDRALSVLAAPPAAAVAAGADPRSGHGTDG